MLNILEPTKLKKLLLSHNINQFTNYRIIIEISCPQFFPRSQHKRKYNTNILYGQIILADTTMAR